MSRVRNSDSPEPSNRLYDATDNEHSTAKPQDATDHQHPSSLVSQPQFQDPLALSGPVWGMLKAALSSLIDEKLKENSTHEEFVKSIVSEEWNKFQQNELSSLTQKFTTDLASSSVYVEIEVQKSKKLIEELQTSYEAQKTQIKELQEALAQQASRLDFLEEFRESHISSARPDSSNQRTPCSFHLGYMKETITKLINNHEQRKLKSLDDISIRQSQIYHRVVLIEKAIVGKGATAENLTSLMAENGSSMELIMTRLSEVVKNNEELSVRVSELEAVSRSESSLFDPVQAPLPSGCVPCFYSEERMAQTPQLLYRYSTYKRSIAQRMPNVVRIFRKITASARTLDGRSLQKSVLLILPFLQWVNAHGRTFLRNLGSLSSNLLEPIHNTLQSTAPVLAAWIVFQSIHWLLTLFVVEEVDVEIMFSSRYRREIVRTGFR